MPWIAWLTPRLLLLFGVGFLVANIRLGASIWCAIDGAAIGAARLAG